MQIIVKVGPEMARSRKARGLTQAELAAVVGVSQRMIAAIEGDERRPSADLAQRIGAELGFPWTVFFDQSVADEYQWTEDSEPGKTGTKGVNVDALGEGT